MLLAQERWMPIERLLRGASFSPEEVRVMAHAYEAVSVKLHDRGQPPVVKELIAKRVIELGKLKALDSRELADRVLASFGLPKV
jgi:hypothetical protein